MPNVVLNAVLLNAALPSVVALMFAALQKTHQNDSD
jgi:hypothetical protein